MGKLTKDQNKQIYMEICPNCRADYKQFCSVHASAPELLEVLKQIQKHGSGLLGKYIDKAIAKAEGKNER